MECIKHIFLDTICNELVFEHSILIIYKIHYPLTVVNNDGELLFVDESFFLSSSSSGLSFAAEISLAINFGVIIQ